MRICSGAGCLRAIPDDARYCDGCRPCATATDADGFKVHTFTDRVRYAFLYKSRRWQALRAVVVREQPTCGACRRRLTAIVDHIVPAGIAIAQARQSGRYRDPYAGFFLRANLQGLCRECHGTKTLEDKAHSGEWPSIAPRPARTWTF